jgi:4-coumarate--CoA ligase
MHNLLTLTFETDTVQLKHVADHKTKYKWLEGGVEFIDAIPKNASGKLLRRVLRDQAREARAKKAQPKL